MCACVDELFIYFMEFYMGKYCMWTCVHPWGSLEKLKYEEEEGQGVSSFLVSLGGVLWKGGMEEMEDGVLCGFSFDVDDVGWLGIVE